MAEPQRVDFYVLDASRDESREQFACRLSERALRADFRVVISCADAAALDALDRLLWAFRDDAFIPHGRLDADHAADSDDPVVLALAATAPLVHHDLLIHLDDAPPRHGMLPGRVAEIVTGDAAARAAGRERFRWYLSQGIRPTTHTLT